MRILTPNLNESRTEAPEPFSARKPVRDAQPFRAQRLPSPRERFAGSRFADRGHVRRHARFPLTVLIHTRKRFFSLSTDRLENPRVPALTVCGSHWGLKVPTILAFGYRQNPRILTASADKSRREPRAPTLTAVDSPRVMRSLRVRGFPVFGTEVPARPSGH